MAKGKIEKIEKIEVFVREQLDNDPFEKAIADAYGAKPKGSTVGVKFSVGGKLYGDYMCFAQSTLSVPDVVESINELFEFLLKEVKKNG